MKSEMTQGDDDKTRSAEGENSKGQADGDDSDNDYEAENTQSTAKANMRELKKRMCRKSKKCSRNWMRSFQL